MKQSTGLNRIKLSKNFMLGEFYVSKKHPAQARAMEILPQHIASLSRLCNTVLQPVRDKIGHTLDVSSGVRNDTLNMLVGGSDDSQHPRAEAGDVDIKADEAWEVFKWAKNTLSGQIGQCIIYLTANLIPYFIHFSIPKLDDKGKIVDALGDFRVKLVGDSTNYKWGQEVIPGVESPFLKPEIVEEVSNPEEPVEETDSTDLDMLDDEFLPDDSE